MDYKEYLDAKESKKSFNRFVNDYANLSEADLSAANLSEADLSEADLSGADLYGANLSGADLSGANLRGADLSAADLYGANLSGANLYGANLREADLRGADLYGANLRGANLRGADLQSELQSLQSENEHLKAMFEGIDKILDEYKFYSNELGYEQFELGESHGIDKLFYAIKQQLAQKKESE